MLNIKYDTEVGDKDPWIPVNVGKISNHFKYLDNRFHIWFRQNIALVASPFLKDIVNTESEDVFDHEWN